ncbi:MAG TPA: zinc-dependent alcohol dehydrogenase family protein [Bacteroidales bacterium]|nr:zinc-dependent alcohol dehydrogenase family protein [Bacteroidales bacterium]
MKAWMIESIMEFTKWVQPLVLQDLPVPEPGKGEILIRVHTCGVCHTELDEIEGRTPPPSLPIVPGHQVIGTVIRHGPETGKYPEGTRVGVAWIYSACSECRFCRSDQENLCPDFKATGRDVHGGYAEFMVAKEDFVYPVPDSFTDVEAAPLLCAGAIGYRSLRLARITNGQILGLTGFGASAHLVLKLARYMYPESKIFVFARQPEEREFALQLGAAWTGDTTDIPPERPEAVIDTTPAWKPVLFALRNLAPGGRLVINAIRKEDADKHFFQQINYPSDLWMEKEIKSVANVERRDVAEFLELAARIPIKPQVEVYDFLQANQALHDIKHRRIRGAKVLRFNHSSA